MPLDQKDLNSEELINVPLCGGKKKKRKKGAGGGLAAGQG